MYDKVKENIIKAQEGDKQAFEELVNNNKGLIWNIVKRFTSNWMFGFCKSNKKI